MCHICGEVKKFLYFAIVIGFICPFLETGRFLRSSSTLPKIKNSDKSPLCASLKISKTHPSIS